MKDRGFIYVKRNCGFIQASSVSIPKSFRPVFYQATKSIRPCILRFKNIILRN